MAKKQTKLCKDCLYEGVMVKHTPGYFLIELNLWLCFIVPGLIYTIWRVSSTHEVCPKCNGVNLIPIDSPLARQMSQKLV